MVQTALKRFLKEHNYEAGYTDLFSLYTTTFSQMYVCHWKKRQTFYSVCMMFLNFC